MCCCELILPVWRNGVAKEKKGKVWKVNNAGSGRFPQCEDVRCLCKYDLLFSSC